MAEQVSLQQSSQLPPAQPTYVLRGHSAQIHSVYFLRQNTRILTGDADGWVVLWSTATKRAVAVWKAHRTTILGLGSWGDERIITHGRDNKLYVWQLSDEDEANLSRKLPIDMEDPATEEGKQPWLLHSLDVNTLNFCSFAMCYDPKSSSEDRGILIATPGIEDGHINVVSLPAEERIATLQGPKGTNTGMVMSLGLVHDKSSQLHILAGYESGHACVWSQKSGKFQVTYLQKTHAQPILSLGISLSHGIFFTSAADAIVARHPLFPGSAVETKTIQTKHAGQQGLAVRDDEKIFATAGWDGRMRVYSVKGMKELAVLKWHGEGCYAVAFANVDTSQGEAGELVKRDLTVAGLRAEKARNTHWLAAGSKDGKVSLWDIY